MLNIVKPSTLSLSPISLPPCYWFVFNLSDFIINPSDLNIHLCYLKFIFKVSINLVIFLLELKKKTLMVFEVLKQGNAFDGNGKT